MRGDSIFHVRQYSRKSWKVLINVGKRTFAEERNKVSLFGSEYSLPVCQFFSFYGVPKKTIGRRVIEI